MLGRGELRQTHVQSTTTTFENKLAGAKTDDVCNRYALAGATAPGSAYGCWGGVSKKEGSGCATSIVKLLTLLLMCIFTAFTATTDPFDLVSSNVFEPSVRYRGPHDLLSYSFGFVRWFCQAIQAFSLFAVSFFGVMIGHLASLRDHTWLLTALLLLVCLCSGLFAYNHFAPAHFVHRNRKLIFAARRVGRARPKHSRTLIRRMHRSAPRIARLGAWKLLSFVFSPVSAFFSLLRKKSIGEFACSGLTPRCSACNAGDGPTPVDSVFSN